MSVRELEPWSRKGKSPICGLSNEQEVEVRNLISRPCLVCGDNARSDGKVDPECGYTRQSCCPKAVDV